MERGGGRKRTAVTDECSSSKKIRQRKNNDTFSCEIHQRFRHESSNSLRLCEHHVTNTPGLQGEQLRKEFAKKLIKRRAVNLWSKDDTSSSHDADCADKTSTDVYHHDDLYHNHLNTVQLLC